METPAGIKPGRPSVEPSKLLILSLTFFGLFLGTLAAYLADVPLLYWLEGLLAVGATLASVGCIYGLSEGK